MQSVKGNVPDDAGNRAKMIYTGSNQMDHGQTLRPTLGGQILPRLLLAAKPRLEFLNGKNVFFFNGLDVLSIVTLYLLLFA
jgi:hypothetical protein